MPRMHYELFTSNGSWTPPPGVTQVLVRAIGGGGGGGSGGSFNHANSGTSSSGAGGGGALRTDTWFGPSTGPVIVPGTPISITIGAGGAGGAAANPPTGITSTGGNGGNTMFGGNVVAYGAQGGGYGQPNPNAATLYYSYGGSPGLGYATLTVHAVTNDGGLIEIQPSFPTNLTGSSIVLIVGVTGVPANGTWAISPIDSTHFTLTGSTFSGSYGGGGFIQRLSLPTTNMPGIAWTPPGQGGLGTNDTSISATDFVSVNGGSTAQGSGGLVGNIVDSGGCGGGGGGAAQWPGTSGGKGGLGGSVFDATSGSPGTLGGGGGGGGGFSYNGTTSSFSMPGGDGGDGALEVIWWQ